MANTKEQKVIEQLTEYKAKKARLQALGTYKVGGGITISRLSEEDELQQLHRRLRGQPSYMYLSSKEQALETVAHTYLERYPAGTRAQLAAVPDIGLYEEDDPLLQQLRDKISKIIDARSGCKSDLDEVLERLAELQDLQAEIERVDQVMQLLDNYSPGYANILRLAFFEKQSWQEIAGKLRISKAEYYRRREKAMRMYMKLAK
ncbi:RNA polymerase subunit sigma-24 [Paenibacillus hubeiensis]|uniref:RNA polymerase subunit sigma-24 n=1 Tax=Paenibacillus hubeiensis TaxID=3077330 RepID=UPI0031BBB76B